MKYKKLSFLVIIQSLSGCDWFFNNDDYDFEYELIVTDSPVNLEKINSIYDDYNSTLPYPGLRYGIYFSSNRINYGENFDIIYKDMDITYHKKDDVLNINYVNHSNSYPDIAIEEINSEFDELGPYYFWGSGSYKYVFYANNASGNFDIKYASVKKGESEITDSALPFEAINSEYDDMYPCIYNENKNLIFCSNREDERFNFYVTAFNEDELNPDSQNSAVDEEIKINEVLSSSGNDKCPFVLQDKIVFASDRPGGFGGFDLYFSENKDGVWSEPQNLGAEINSEYDEYRPIIVPFHEFDETMLIFSSNRPGGKGGFDLYAVRTEK